MVNGTVESNDDTPRNNGFKYQSDQYLSNAVVFFWLSELFCSVNQSNHSLLLIKYFTLHPQSNAGKLHCKFLLSHRGGHPLSKGRALSFHG